MSKSPIRLGSRAANRSLVLRQVLRARRISRSQIAATTGLSMGAVSRITQELIGVGLLMAVGAHAPAGKRGPRFVELALAPRGGFVLGLDIEASVQHALIVDLAGQIITRQRIQFSHLADPRTSIERLGRDLQRMITRSSIDRGRLFGVGVAAVGVVDPVEGVIVDSPFGGWRHVELARLLREELDLAVRVDSMLNALNAAENRYGLSRGKRNVVLVHTTLGIGASFLADGVVVRGQGMQAGQIAHARVAGSNLPCACGRRGCLNTVASGHAVLRTLGLWPPPNGEGEGDLERELDLLNRVLGRADQNSEAEVSALVNSGRALGRFLGTVVAFCSPEGILLAGRLGAHPSYVWGVRDGLREYLPAGRNLDVSAASMGGENAATLLAVEELVCSPPLEIERFAPRRSRRQAA